MTWLLWRQHRAQTFVTTAALLLFAVAVLLTGVHMAHVYDDAFRQCTRNGTCDLVRNLFSGYGAIIDVVHLSIAVPVVLGVFLGAPLVARETEHATNVLVWTQTVTRRRWLFSKVTTVLAASVVIAAAVSALVTWWSSTPNALYGNRFEGAQFDSQNIVPIAYALFAVALGLAAGAVFRRTLPALAATVGIYTAVRVAVSVYVRPLYMKAVTRSFAFNASVNLPSGSRTLSQHTLSPTGQALSDANVEIPSACGNARRGVEQCLGRLGYRNVVRFQPPSHYWQFQWTEAALFTVLAAVLVAFALAHTLRHDA